MDCHTHPTYRYTDARLFAEGEPCQGGDPPDVSPRTPGVFAAQSRCRIHDLRCWPPHFEDVDSGAKTVEIREDDRGYRVGDILVLREWDPDMRTKDIQPDGDGPYTGRVCKRVVTHVLPGGQFGLVEGYVALSLSEWCSEPGCVRPVACHPDSMHLTEDGREFSDQTETTSTPLMRVVR